MKIQYPLTERLRPQICINCNSPAHFRIYWVLDMSKVSSKENADYTNLCDPCFRIHITSCHDALQSS